MLQPVIGQQEYLLLTMMLLCRNDEAESIYTSLYTFDNGRCVFDEESYEAQKPELISLIQAIIARLDELNDGSYYTMECEYEKQVLSG